MGVIEPNLRLCRAWVQKGPKIINWPTDSRLSSSTGHGVIHFILSNFCFCICCTYSSLHLEIFIKFNATSYSVGEGGIVHLVILKVGIGEESVTVTLSTQQGTADSKNSQNNSLCMKSSCHVAGISSCAFSDTSVSYSVWFHKCVRCPCELCTWWVSKDSGNWDYSRRYSGEHRTVHSHHHCCVRESHYHRGYS